MTAVFEFTNPTAGRLISIVTELTRAFDLSTALLGEVASGGTALPLAIFNEGEIFLSCAARYGLEAYGKHRAGDETSRLRHAKIRAITLLA